MGKAMNQGDENDRRQHHFQQRDECLSEGLHGDRPLRCGETEDDGSNKCYQHLYVEFLQLIHGISWPENGHHYSCGNTSLDG